MQIFTKANNLLDELCNDPLKRNKIDDIHYEADHIDIYQVGIL